MKAIYKVCWLSYGDMEDLFRIYSDPATNTFNPVGPYLDIRYAGNVLIIGCGTSMITHSETGAIAAKGSPGHTTEVHSHDYNTKQNLYPHHLSYFPYRVPPPILSPTQ